MGFCLLISTESTGFAELLRTVFFVCAVVSWDLRGQTPLAFRARCLEFLSGGQSMWGILCAVRTPLFSGEARSWGSTLILCLACGLWLEVVSAFPFQGLCFLPLSCAGVP